MRGQAVLSLASGLLFGAGLAVSGMLDPARVRAFLDVGGQWDPTLAFVMAGAIVPSALAWVVVGRRSRPVVADAFNLPATRPVDARLVGGATVFGIGWGLAGLCPGPAVAALAVAPVPAAVMCAAMVVGFGAFRLLPVPTERKGAGDGLQQA